jgi:hypothetical protein
MHSDFAHGHRVVSCACGACCRCSMLTTAAAFGLLESEDISSQGRGRLVPRRTPATLAAQPACLAVNQIEVARLGAVRCSCGFCPHCSMRDSARAFGLVSPDDREGARIAPQCAMCAPSTGAAMQLASSSPASMGMPPSDYDSIAPRDIAASAPATHFSDEHNRQGSFASRSTGMSGSHPTLLHGGQDERRQPQATEV